MNEIQIKRKGIWDSLGNVSLSDWANAAERMGLPYTCPNGGSSHKAIRKPTNPIDYTEAGVISVVYDGMSKQVNQKVFKKLLIYGIKEDDIWKALKKIK